MPQIGKPQVDPTHESSICALPFSLTIQLAVPIERVCHFAVNLLTKLKRPSSLSAFHK